ncbi:MAG: hypothetical protein ACR2P1_02425 [Pseudomonadales bacterium]
MATAKTTAKKTTVKKRTAKKTTTSKQKANTSTIEDFSSTMRDATDAGLGFYGTIYDEVQDRVAQLRKAAPKQWNAYIKRGQKVRKDINNKIDTPDFPVNFDRDEVREQVQSMVEKVKTLLTPAQA